MATAKTPPKIIVIQYNDKARQWRAHFEEEPKAAFGSDIPMDAVRRLLVANKSVAGSYELRCDQDQSGGAPIIRMATWQPKPPELLFECPECAGTGKTGGPTDFVTCPECHGKKVVAG